MFLKRHFPKLAKVQPHISGIQKKGNSEALQRMQRKSTKGIESLAKLSGTFAKICQISKLFNTNQRNSAEPCRFFKNEEIQMECARLSVFGHLVALDRRQND